MDVDEAAGMLAAIGHPVRLRIYRSLIEAGHCGRPAGELAASLSVAPSSLSFHLKELVHAGLIHSKQQGRFVIYSVTFESMAELMSFLVRDCCQGNPCLPVQVLSVEPDDVSACQPHARLPALK